MACGADAESAALEIHSEVGQWRDREVNPPAFDLEPKSLTGGGVGGNQEFVRLHPAHDHTFAGRDLVPVALECRRIGRMWRRVGTGTINTPARGNEDFVGRPGAYLKTCGLFCNVDAMAQVPGLFRSRVLGAGVVC